MVKHLILKNYEWTNGDSELYRRNSLVLKYIMINDRKSQNFIYNYTIHISVLASLMNQVRSGKVYGLIL